MFSKDFWTEWLSEQIMYALTLLAYIIHNFNMFIFGFNDSFIILPKHEMSTSYVWGPMFGTYFYLIFFFPFCI